MCAHVAVPQDFVRLLQLLKPHVGLGSRDMNRHRMFFPQFLLQTFVRLEVLVSSNMHFSKTLQLRAPRIAVPNRAHNVTQTDKVIELLLEQNLLGQKDVSVAILARLARQLLSEANEENP